MNITYTKAWELVIRNAKEQIPWQLLQIQYHKENLARSVFHMCASKFLVGYLCIGQNGINYMIWIYQDNNSILCCNLFWTMIHTYNTST